MLVPIKKKKTQLFYIMVAYYVIFNSLVSSGNINAASFLIFFVTC